MAEEQHQRDLFDHSSLFFVVFSSAKGTVCKCPICCSTVEVATTCPWTYLDHQKSNCSTLPKKWVWGE